MSFDVKLEHSFEELKTKLIDKSMFGQDDRLLAIVSWIDLYKAHLKPTYDDAITFINKYLIQDKPKVLDFSKILPEKDMKHSYDNAFRIEIQKQDSSYKVYHVY